MGDYQNASRDSRDLQSPVLATIYAHTASSLIRTIAKNFVFIVAAISAVTILAVLDVLHVVGYMKVIYNLD